jgi:CRISPR type III-A-associated protein Csm2
VNQEQPGAPAPQPGPQKEPQRDPQREGGRREGGPREGRRQGGARREVMRRDERPRGPEPLGADDVRRILDGDADLIVRCAERLAEHLLRSHVRRGQVRAVYLALARIRQASPTSRPEQLRQLKLLIPRLHYMAARRRETDPLRSALEALIRELPSAGSPALERALASTFDFAEAVVAYHAGAE